MKAVNIKLSLAENVKTFVNIANRYPYDIDLRVGRQRDDPRDAGRRKTASAEIPSVPAGSNK